MRTFKDKEGVEWEIDLTLNDFAKFEAQDFSLALKVEEPRPISFFPPEKDLFDELLTNPNVVLGCVWCHIEEKAKERDITKIDQFAGRLKGEHITDMKVAFWEELPAFFPQATTSLTALIEVYSRAQTILDRKVKGKLDKMTDEEIEKILDEEIQEAGLGS